MEDQNQKVVRSKDVMEALHDLFNSLRGQRLPVSELGIYVYQSLSAVPEFYAPDLQPTVNVPEQEGKKK